MDCSKGIKAGREDVDVARITVLIVSITNTFFFFHFSVCLPQRISSHFSLTISH